MTGGDADLRSLLNIWTPDQLEYISLKISEFDDESVKADFYIDSLCNTFRTVTREVYIEWLELTASDLERIVKASSNSEKLVIKYCSVICSTALDFAIATKYKTKFMSFDNWTGFSSDTKFDIMSNPTFFESIGEAIKNSGLKDSLQYVEIDGCKLEKTDDNNFSMSTEWAVFQLFKSE